MLEPVHERIRRDEHFELLPCVWLDLSTLRCRHYEFRPQACRDFEIGSTLCRLSRDDEGVEGVQNSSRIGEPSASSGTGRC
jgi:Fe-S-cluster containining protein